MADYQVETITRSEDLPELSSEDFFHSPEHFWILEQSRDASPYMIVVRDAEGNVLSHLLAMLRRRGSLLPPYLFSQGRVYGEGVYRDKERKGELFPIMLKAVNRAFHNKLCLYTEFSDLSRKMFGYRAFRRNAYFPVPWMHIHNSLHSKPPEERLTDKTMARIRRARRDGLVTREASNDFEIETFHRLLHRHYRFKMHRYIPGLNYFLQMAKSIDVRVFVTLWRDKIIGGSMMVYSAHNAYLWYTASLNKTHPLLHPDLLTVWHCIEEAHKDRRDHVIFMNVGLPFRANRYRDFILRFGGKPVSTYRWFHFTVGWLNRLLSWFYRE